MKRRDREPVSDIEAIVRALLFAVLAGAFVVGLSFWVAGKLNGC